MQLNIELILKDENRPRFESSTYTRNFSDVEVNFTGDYMIIMRINPFIDEISDECHVFPLSCVVKYKITKLNNNK